MLLKPIPAAAALVVALQMIATSAHALDGDCIWESIPPERRAEIIDAYRQHGMNAPYPYVEADFASIDRCMSGEADPEEAGLITLLIFFEKGSAAKLIEEFGATQASLDEAWSILTSAHRATLSSAALKPPGEPTPAEHEALDAVVAAFQRSTSLPAAAADQLKAYVVGRGFREALTAAS